MAFLQLIGGTQHGRRFPLEHAICTLGRQPDCYASGIFQTDKSVSRQHAKITERKGQYFLEDLGSVAGTLLNGQRLKEKRELRDGDQLTICAYDFVFYQQPLPDDSDGSFDSSAHIRMKLVEEASASSVEHKVDVGSSWGSAGIGSLANSEAKLKAILELLGTLGTSLELNKMLEGVLEALLKIFPQAERAFIGLQIAENRPIAPAAVRQREGDSTTVRVSRAIVDQVIAKKQAVLSVDTASDFDGSESVVSAGIQSVMCAPLLDLAGNVSGILQIDTKQSRRKFQTSDLEVLANLAPLAAFAVKFARLHGQAFRQHALETDLQLAQRVQHRLLPPRPPEIEHYDFHAHYQPAREIGGDYYDFIRLPSGALGVVVADVSGKGISAALVMARLSGELKCLLASEASAAAAIGALNRSLCTGGVEGQFVTMALAVLDNQRHEVTLVNAGHPDPLLRSADGEVQSIGAPSRGLVLGVDPNHVYLEHYLPLAPGDTLMLYTDGFSEAQDADEELYGEPRLQECLAESSPGVEDIVQLILADVKRFVAGNPQSDDMCLVCLKREE